MNPSQIKFGENVSVNLYSEIAETFAKDIAATQDRNANKGTQLRRFYDELVMWHDKVFHERGNERIKRCTELLPYIQMLNAKVAYAKGRGHVDGPYQELFSACVKQVNDPDTLRQCKLFFEAFMGYYKVYGPK